MKVKVEMKAINLTPHAINVVNDNGESIITFEPSGTVARVSCKTVVTGKVMGIPVTETAYGTVEGLPEAQDGIIYIVSALVAQRCKDRNDVFIPNESVRDDKGRIIGCKSLGRI